MMKLSAGLLVVALWACQSESSVAPETWIGDGDSDGDGLKDDFEIRHGLDPQKAESFADGIPDEDRMGSDGKTMWDAQAAGSSTPVGGAGSGGACGALGVDGLALAVLIALFRRRAGRRF